MRYIKLMTLTGALINLVHPAEAAPRAITAMASPATTYSFFTVDSRRTGGRSVPTVQADWQRQLDANGTGLTACWVTGDLNVTNFSCGGGAMRFGNTELYTYNLESNIPGVPFRDRAVGESQGANFRSPTATLPADAVGSVIRIHFDRRVAQFGMLVDAGVATAPTITGVQFLVNRQTTPVQPAVPGQPSFVGVEDPQGFTDVLIVPVGPVGLSRAFIADRFAFVPLSAF